jgi:predicted ferric reductase
MTAALSDPRLLWFLSRASGLVCLALLTGSLVLGIVSARARTKPWWPIFMTQRLHRNFSLVAILLLVVHVGTILIDGYVPIGVIDVVVPFRSGYHTWWLGLGTVAVDLLALLVGTSLARRRLGPRAWGLIHLTAHLCWPAAVAHGLGIGTDATLLPVLAFTIGCCLLVAAAIGWRLAGRGRLPVAPSLRA